MTKEEKRKLLLSLGKGIVDANVGTTAALIALYDKLFSRFERPDYALVPGAYCLSRYGSELEREELWFSSDGVLLRGYYYPIDRPKGLVVISHGIHAGADDYLPMIFYLTRHGYACFAFDDKGTYDSGGDSTVGMCESLVDLDHALDFLQSDYRFSSFPLFLLGHSWGGYAVTSVLSLKKNIRACVGIAPMNDGYSVIAEKGAEYVGQLTGLQKPLLDRYQKSLFGRYVEYNGTRGINDSFVPVLIAQGMDDKVITYDGQSVTAHRSELRHEQVYYHITKGLRGDHNNIWHSKDSIIYQSEVESDLRHMKKAKGKELSYEDKLYYFEKIDHRLYSEADPELMERITALFDSTLF